MKIWVRGELYPSNKETIGNIFAYRWLCKTFLRGNDRSQYIIRKRQEDNLKWKEGETFPVYIEQKAKGIPPEALAALNYINNALNEPIAHTLQLNGYLNIILEGEAGILVYNIRIKENRIAYREPITNWDAPITTLPIPRQIQTNVRDIKNCEPIYAKDLLRKLDPPKETD